MVAEPTRADRPSSSIVRLQKLRCYKQCMDTQSCVESTLSDADLIARLRKLAGSERAMTCRLLRTLIEFDSRKLYLREGYSSLFAYCTHELHYAEHAALNRIEVARAARRIPVILERIADGTINLTGMRLLAPHLTENNAHELLAAARHKSKREIEEVVASLRPRPDVAPLVRKLPDRPVPGEVSWTEPQPKPEEPQVVSRSVVAPLAPERYKVQFTIDRETRDKLRRVQDLMRHTIPNGDPAKIFDRALTLLVQDLERKRFASTSQPKPSRAPADRRHIPAHVRRKVWQRDGGRCAFVGSRGRCGEETFIEFHHLVPFALGGLATVENIELRCRAHNAYEATLFFGGR